MTINTTPVKNFKCKPIKNLSTWVQVIFMISALLAAIAVFSGVLQLQLLYRALTDEFISESEATTNDTREAIIAFFQTTFLILGIVFFLMWVYRANKNLHSLKKYNLEFTPGWSIGYFFIPIASLFMPYQAVSEISKASNPAIEPDLVSVKRLPTPAIVIVWWTFFLLCNFIGNITSRFISQGASITDLLTSTYVYIVSDSISIIGLIITVIMVKRISESQELKFLKTSPVT